ncbi:hypothetical protein L4C42_14225 [Vibrio wakamikoensis]|uniref:hypothetical protein n=1 Tax=Vibrio wakamikoensis TaxID=2910251 RepID=UPI003D24F73D
MTKLTDQMRAEIINVLVEGESYRESIDMQRFLVRGVTEFEIGLIDTAIRLLHESPYLSDVDFENLGFSHKGIQRVLGGVNHFKTLLHIEEYSLMAWVQDNGLQDENCITLPYFVYQHYVDEIRANHLEGFALTSYFQVDLGQQLARAMTFKCGTSLLLPKDPMEIAAYIILSRFGRYRSMTYDFERTILTAENEHRSIEIEVKVFSSQLTRTTPIAVCLIDDIPELDYVSRSSTKILHLHDFSMRHENGANRELLKAMNF